MKNTIWFDMDGTVADLYNRQNWLGLLETESPIFADLDPICDIEELARLCTKLFSIGYRIGIITWLPAHASADYRTTCTADKNAWLAQNMPYITEVHTLPYGTPKQNAGFDRGTYNYLVDDNNEIIHTWEQSLNNIGIQVAEGNTCSILRNYFGI